MEGGIRTSLTREKLDPIVIEAMKPIDKHRWSIAQKGEHEDPYCRECHIQDVKEKNIDCGDCPWCIEEARNIYELIHDL